MGKKRTAKMGNKKNNKQVKSLNPAAPVTKIFIGFNIYDYR
jgi:hypothetical protein